MNMLDAWTIAHLDRWLASEIGNYLSDDEITYARYAMIQAAIDDPIWLDRGWDKLYYEQIEPLSPNATKCA